MHILTPATLTGAIGGLERAQLETCRQLRARGHHIDLLYTEAGDLDPAWAAVASHREQVRGYALYRKRPLRSVADVGKVVARVRRLRPDVVYFHNHRHALAMGLSGRALACHLHLPPPSTPSLQDNVGLRRVRRFLSVSRFTAQQWSEFLGRDPRDFSIVANGVDLERFTVMNDVERSAVRRDLGVTAEKRLLVYAGRVDPEKGVDVALDAMRLLGAQHFRLAVAGDPNPGSFGGDAAAAGAYGERLRGEFGDVSVTWLGHRSDVPRLLAAADVVVLPSRFADPLPLIVLETLASGTPIVASRVGGIPEMLSGRFEEWLVPAGDATALAAKVRRLSDWRAREPGLGMTGRRHVEANYTLAKMGHRVTEAIETAAAGE